MITGWRAATGIVSLAVGIRRRVRPEPRGLHAIPSGVDQGIHRHPLRLLFRSVPVDRFLHDWAAFAANFPKLDLPNLWKPRVDAFHRVDALPMLGTGKLDLKGAKELAIRLVANEASEPATDPS